MGNTWGISGPVFLAVYAVLLVAAALFAAVWRRHALRADVDDRSDDLHPVELAYLRDGPDLAVLVAYLCLYRRGRLVVDGLPVADAGTRPARLSREELMRLEHGRVTLAGVRGGGHPLEDALASSIAAGDTHAQRLARLRASPEMHAIEAKLTGRGLRVDRARVRRVRLGAFPLVAVLALGIARLSAGMANGKPVGFLVMLLVLTVVALWHALRPATAIPAAAGVLARAGADFEREAGILTRTAADQTYGVQDRELAAVGANPLAVAAFGPAVAFVGVPLLAASFGFVPPADLHLAGGFGGAAAGAGWRWGLGAGSGGYSCGGGGGCGGGGCGSGGGGCGG